MDENNTTISPEEQPAMETLPAEVDHPPASSIGTIQQYLDDAKMSLELARHTLRKLLPKEIQYEAYLREVSLQPSVWGPLAAKYLGQGLKTEDGLRVSALLDAMEDMVHAYGLIVVSATVLGLSTRAPDLKLGRMRRES